MDWPIQEVARLAGTTSRTLRHYAQVGLVQPSRVGANGYRYYDEAALVRLQRVLMLRELGLGLPAIAGVLAEQADEPTALRAHLEWLEAERARLARQIASVRRTLDTITEKGQLMAENMFDGFDHTVYKDEVEERWGAAAYAAGDSWWRAKSPEQKKAWQAELARLGADWQDAAARGVAPAGAEAQALAQRQYDWLAAVPGTPGSDGGGPTKAYFTGLGELYANDERFAANYGGTAGAAFVRDAMAVFAERHLS
ncbi:MerR family transcriptional regulator [Herbiconiux daphne]|uniref:MerR family transcriptional regulator n=1 Tax=Herbiconiux daphne TaxID=2970914 RepID=A0ABT2H405_9MICO|nr:MerR family transcriptional regulator [Herbiconiux daphne]MCS5734653.1 MerR family transcriptional regulator [Herbiconiux daphne]